MTLLPRMKRLTCILKASDGVLSLLSFKQKHPNYSVRVSERRIDLSKVSDAILLWEQTPDKFQ